jgi:hypothetical protein
MTTTGEGFAEGYIGPVCALPEVANNKNNTAAKDVICFVLAMIAGF